MGKIIGTSGIGLIVFVSLSTAGAQWLGWIAGEVGPESWTISPKNPTTEDEIWFSGPTRIYSNVCFAEGGAGVPRLTIDSVNRRIELWFEPPLPGPCTLDWNPVCGLYGGFGPLERGDWVFFSRNQIANISILFRVDPAVCELEVKILGQGSVRQDPEPPYRFKGKVALLAEAEEGWRFACWGGDVRWDYETDNPITLTMDDDKSVTAIFGRLICVPGDYPMIQAAIDAASDYDTVAASPGTYVENIHFGGKNLRLRSTDPTDAEVVAATIIDGNQGGSVVTFAGTEERVCLLSGFTIQNGAANFGAGICGGTWKNHTQATIRHNVIRGNHAGGEEACHAAGGGLAFCDGTIERNKIAGNRATIAALWSWSSAGGGLHSCNGRILSNTICENYAGLGGGLHWCDAVISYNVIMGNWAYTDGGGLGRCSSVIWHNSITGNFANQNGGGLFVCDGAIQNNTIAGNRAEKNGGGMSECSATIQNCVIWANEAPEGEQMHNCRAPSYSCIQGWAGDGEGNIVAPPRFVDPDGADDDLEAQEDNDYRLAEGSPCIDTGENKSWMWQQVDLDGRPRILHGTSSLTVDMGAYEYWPKRFVQCHIERAEMNYATGIFFVPVSVTGPACPSPGALTTWLVVRDVAFAVPGPRSEGRPWNADGIASEGYAGSADYFYYDVSDSIPADPVETSEVMLELYIKDRNPNFRPEIELWPFRPITNSLQDSPGVGIAPPADDQSNREECPMGTPAMDRQSSFRVKRMALAPGGAILIQWECASDIELVMEAADSPVGPWTAISDRLRSLLGLGHWVDSAPRNSKCRFYRMRQVF